MKTPFRILIRNGVLLKKYTPMTGCTLRTHHPATFVKRDLPCWPRIHASKSRARRHPLRFPIHETLQFDFLDVPVPLSDNVVASSETLIIFVTYHFPNTAIGVADVALVCGGPPKICVKLRH